MGAVVSSLRAERSSVTSYVSSLLSSLLLRIVRGLLFLSCLPCRVWHSRYDWSEDVFPTSPSLLSLSGPSSRKHCLYC